MMRRKAARVKYQADALKKKLRRFKIDSQRKRHAEIVNDIQKLGIQITIDMQAGLPETMSSNPYECEELRPDYLFLRHDGEKIPKEDGVSRWSYYREIILEYSSCSPPPPNKTEADREGFYLSLKERVPDEFYDYMWLYAGGGKFYRSKVDKDKLPVTLQLKFANLNYLQDYKNIWCYVNPHK